MPQTSRSSALSDYTKVYRVEPQFRETVGILRQPSLYVRQLAESAFTLIVRDPQNKTDYVLAPARSPHAPRTFTNLGRCVQAAVRMTVLKTIHFELLDEPIVEVDDP